MKKNTKNTKTLKEKRVTIRFTSEIYNYIVEQAKSNNITVVEHIRNLVLSDKEKNKSVH